MLPESESRKEPSRFHAIDGSSFVVSILLLFVMSILGMAAMLATTTEKDIAINYRWSEQAFFNADAGLEYGKNVLGAYLLADGDFARILPPPRPEATVADPAAPWGAAHPDPGACRPEEPGCRDYQYYVDRCPQGGGGPCVRVYIGKVLRRADGTPAQHDFRLANATTAGDLDGDGAAELQGSVTLWVRRPMVGSDDYGRPDALHPEGRHDRVVLTAEGTAPASLTGRAASLRRLEFTVRNPRSGVEGESDGIVAAASDGGSRKLFYEEVKVWTFGTP